MTISNALPVQFWLNGVESYNDKEVCGITTVCWCQPFECDDEINIQFADDSDADYNLSIYDTNDTLIESIAFNRATTLIYEDPSLADLSTFTDQGSGVDWTLGANPDVDLDIDTPGQEESKVLIGLITDGFQGIDYLFSYDIDITRTGGATGWNVAPTFYLYNSDFSQNVSVTFTGGDVFTGGAADNFTGTVTLTPDFTPVYFGISVEHTAGLLVNLNVDINSIILTSTTIDNGISSLYDLSIIPSEYDICDQSIILKITTDASPETVVASSDCLSIKTTHNCTLPIEYTNSRDFAGLIYSDQSPVPTFTLRIPAIFFEEDNPAEQEDHELSSGDIVRLYNKLERRRKLDIGFLPAYMHEKLQLILMHDTIIIDELEWIRREAYEKIEGNKRYPLKRASVFLHDKNFIKENQL